MLQRVAFLGVIASCIYLSARVHAFETGDDLKLDPDRYLGKKVSLLGVIDAGYEPLKAPSGAGSFLLWILERMFVKVTAITVAQSLINKVR